MSQISQRKSHSVRFSTPSGLTLAGTLDSPEMQAPRGLAIFAHHFAGSRQSPAATRICKALAERKIACLRFDFPGLGSSEGHFPDSSLTQYTENVVTAAQWLTTQTAQETATDLPLILIGHSLGGDAVIKATPECESVRGVVTIGTPFTPAHTILRSSALREPTTEGSDTIFPTKEGQHGGNSSHYIVTLGGYEIAISDSFVEDLQHTEMSPALEALTCPLLILHSDADDIVPIRDAELIFENAHYPKSLIDLHGGDHLLSKRGSAQRAAQIIASWFEGL